MGFKSIITILTNNNNIQPINVCMSNFPNKGNNINNSKDSMSI